MITGCNLNIKMYDILYLLDTHCRNRLFRIMHNENYSICYGEKNTNKLFLDVDDRHSTIEENSSVY